MPFNIINKANENLDLLCDLLTSHGLVPICVKLTDHEPATYIQVMGESQLKVHCSLFSDSEARFSFYKNTSRIQMRLVYTGVGTRLFGKEEFFKHLYKTIND